MREKVVLLTCNWHVSLTDAGIVPNSDHLNSCFCSQQTVLFLMTEKDNYTTFAATLLYYQLIVKAHRPVTGKAETV